MIRKMNVETAKMSERGQIIIPKEVREGIHAKADTLFAVSTLDKNTIVMRKIDTDSLAKEFRLIRSRTRKLSPKQIEEEIHASRKGRA